MEATFIDNLKALIGNSIAVSALLGWFVAQFLKIVITFIVHKKIKLSMISANGGMPSAHSSTVIAATTAAAISCGFDSAAFAITMMLALIVMNDAAGVRWQTGQLAQAIKRLWDERADKKELDIRLKDVMGHRPLEIVVGAVVGCLVAICYAWVFKLITGELPIIR